MALTSLRDSVHALLNAHELRTHARFDADDRCVTPRCSGPGAVSVGDREHSCLVQSQPMGAVPWSRSLAAACLLFMKGLWHWCLLGIVRTVLRERVLCSYLACSLCADVVYLYLFHATTHSAAIHWPILRCPSPPHARWKERCADVGAPACCANAVSFA